jgi:cell division protein FtsB
MSNFFSSTGVAELIEWLGLTSAGGVLGWFSAKRKRDAEGVEATIKVWERTVEHLEEQLDDLRKENVELRQEVRDLRILVHELQSKLMVKE